MTAKFDVNDKFNASKNYTGIRFGTDAKLLEVELNEMQKIQDHARAELVRQMAHSGVLDYSSQKTTSGSALKKGGFYENIGSTTWRESLNVGEFDVVVNGHIIAVKGFEGVSPDINRISLPEPPTHGTREDLVFLEAWFEEVTFANDGDILDSRIGKETSRRTKLNWRIRTVAGVDFNAKFSDGTTSDKYIGWTNSVLFSKVFAKGANENIELPSSVGGWKLFRNADYVYTGGKFSDDKGLWVAGLGNQESKDYYKTADGYVYAIPLFRVKRRNSGGYREDNVNGARLHPSITTVSSTTKITLTSGVVTTFTTVEDVSAMMVGDRLWAAFSNGTGVEVVSVNGTNSITVLPSATFEIGNGVGLSLRIPNSSSAYGGYPLNANRPDGKYANIIHKDDIIDLRHKVSLNGYNYQQLMADGFSKLGRGELQKAEMKKERFGLTPAPLGMEAQLMPTKVKLVDGTEKELVNLLSNHSIRTFLLRRGSLSESGEREITVTPNLGFSAVGKYVNLESSKKYLGITLVKVNTGSEKFTVSLSDNVDSTSILASGTKDVGTTYVPITWAFSPIETREYFYRGVYHSNSSYNFNYTFKEMRLYEIDQATYDKIDVDPEFTGEKLAEKFPYVSSYPNVVENLFDINSTFGENYVNSDGALSVNSTYNAYRIPVVPNTPYTFKNYGLDVNLRIIVRFENSDKNYLSVNTTSVWDGSVGTVTTPTNCSFIVFSISKASIQNGRIVELVKGSQPSPIYVPYGRWLLPYDYANGDTPTRLTDYTEQRKTFSDAQTSETVTEIVEALKTPQKHIAVTQATEGQWKAGDTIKVKSDNGVISGVIDADTSYARITGGASTTGESTKVIVDSVSALSVGDLVNVYSGTDFGLWVPNRTITAIDIATKTVTFNGAMPNDAGHYLVETTTSTSSPVTTATGLVGTWSGLGTKEATFTITTPPTTDTDPIRIEYSVNYPAGKGIEKVPSEVLGVKVNGLNYVKSNTLKLVANFEGKVSGSTAENPHVHKRISATTIKPPSGITFEPPSSEMTSMSTLDGTLSKETATTNGAFAQQLFSFNLIEEIKRNVGNIPFNVIADMRQWCIDNIANVTVNWHGFGSNVGGNKANFSVWNVTSNLWEGKLTNTSTGTSKLAQSNPSAYISNRMDANGFMHWLAYAEPSDGVTPSVITTDYVELEIELKSSAETGYDVFVPENPKKVMIDSPEMFKEGENMLPPFTSGLWSLHANAKVISPYELELNATAIDQYSYVQIPIQPNVPCYYAGEGNAAMYRVHLRRKDGSIINSSAYIGSFTTTVDTAIAEIRVTNSSLGNGKFLLKNPMLTLGSTPKPFVPYSKDIKRKKLLDFRGKVVGSTWENPHKAFTRAGTLSTSPTAGFADMTQADITNIGVLDGVLARRSNSREGEFAHQMFEFDLSHLGLSLSELKKALKKLTVKWTGYGKGDNAGALGYGSTLKWWGVNTGNWTRINTNSTSEPSTITVSTTSASDTNYFISKDQKVYILVHSTYPAGEASPSEIFTDYISLEVELAEWVDQVKKNVVKIRPSTKELKLVYPTKSHATGRQDSVELFYNHLPPHAVTLSGTVTEILKANEYVISTVGTGAYSAETNKLIQTILTDASPYLGKSLHSFVTKGLKRLPLETDERIASKFDTNQPYVALTYSLVENNGELFLRVYYKESKDVSAYINMDKFVDFKIPGNPLVKGGV